MEHIHALRRAGLSAPERVGLNPTKYQGINMRTTQQMSISLPIEMADAVKSRVRSGEYASESEVIRDGLRALLARDRAIESWLRETVVPTARALKDDPSQALSADEVRAHLSERRKAKARA